MDNLDRTNVVQATLAKHTLNKQLQEAGVLTKEQGVDDFETLSKDFRESESSRHFPRGVFYDKTVTISVG